MRQASRRMNSGGGIWWILGALALLAAVVCFAQEAPISPPATQPALTTFIIAGDSTAANGGGAAVGWGKIFPQFIDPAKAKVVNGARGGTSSRTFYRDAWEALVAQAKIGDYVLIQFGHNDIGAVNDESRARGSLPGTGDETQEIDNLVTKKHETVHTYGWYLKKMIADVKAKGATPILLSITVRSEWKDGKVERGFGEGKYGEWSREVAKGAGVPFIDLTNIIADRYEQMGEAAVKPMFPRDTTHNTEEGARLSAEMVVAGLKALHRQLIIQCLSAAGRAIDPVPQNQVVLGRNARGTPWETKNFLNEALPGDPALPSIILIGDSTVRNSRADGSGGQWGWGEPLAAHFDPAKVNVVNRALGGTTSGSFYFGQWNDVIALVKKGDFVLMQFGTNSGGVELRGTGKETEERDGRNGQKQTVRTYGGYMRQFIADVKAKGATPMVCTLIPRNSWKDGKVTRSAGGQADWAREVAKAENVPLLDLYETIATKYDSLGKDTVAPLFADGSVHTGARGAEINAECVVAALHALPENPTAKFERTKPAATW